MSAFKLGLRLEVLKKERQGLHAHGTDLIGEKLATQHLIGQAIEPNVHNLEHGQAIQIWAEAVQNNDAELARAETQGNTLTEGRPSMKRDPAAYRLSLQERYKETLSLAGLYLALAQEIPSSTPEAEEVAKRYARRVNRLRKLRYAFAAKQDTQAGRSL